MISSQLLKQTRKLWSARDADLTFKQVSRFTGLTQSWLKHFDSNRSEAPAVDKIETLYRYLSGKELKLD